MRIDLHAIARRPATTVSALAFTALVWVLPMHAEEATAKFMDCNGAPLCGVLTLETGLGRGPYEHAAPSLHGLWPQVGKYGSSQCLRPTKSAAAPKELYPCYQSSDTPYQRQLSFEQHEWTKHGRCAGAVDAEDYLLKACSLSSAPLQLMATERSAGMFELGAFARRLELAGFPVFALDHRNMQLELSACAGDDGAWVLAKPSDFRARCGGRASSSTTTPPVRVPMPVEPAPNAALSCVRNVKGPKCGTDSDCGYSGCVRCARSGFCTDQALNNGRPG